MRPSRRHQRTVALPPVRPPSCRRTTVRFNALLCWWGELSSAVGAPSSGRIVAQGAAVEPGTRVPSRRFGRDRRLAAAYGTVFASSNRRPQGRYQECRKRVCRLAAVRVAVVARGTANSVVDVAADSQRVFAVVSRWATLAATLPHLRPPCRPVRGCRAAEPTRTSLTSLRLTATGQIPPGQLPPGV